MSATRKQDLPPPGGYRPIPFERIKAKTLFSGAAMLGGFAVFQLFTIYIYSFNHRKVRREDLEMKSSNMAIYPLLLAERDRAFLKQLRINRDAEEELMKDVEGWEVGTLFGEPIYYTLPKDSFVKPLLDEYFCFASDKSYKRATEGWLWT